MNLLIMGLPGAGKGTQAETIVETYGVQHISTGDMFRAAMKNETEMGKLAKSFIDKGELVPDDVTNGIVKERLAQEDIQASGFKLDAVVNIDVDPSVLVERLSGRFICRTCGATYHKVFNPTKVAGTCDKCGGHDFYQREDDKPETVKNRLDINIKQGAPILEHYAKLGLVKDVDGQQDIDKVSETIKTILG